MTALQLAELNGLLALVVDRRVDRARGLDPETVTDQVLAEVRAPDLDAALGRLASKVDKI